jgi:alanyl aminopeptidase
MSRWQQFFAFLMVITIGVFCVQIYSKVQHERHIAEKKSSPQGQLPDNITPISYDLRLRINPSLQRFSGVARISIHIKKPVKEIWIHGRNLRTNKVVLHSNAGPISLEYKEMGRSGVVLLTSQQTILAQTALLEIHYNAPFNTKLSGLYKVKDSEQPYIFSQFEPVDARRAFPGFDEPRFKVPFDVTLEIKQSDKGFSNTRQINEERLADGYKRLTFATTKPLPTYLVAFIVGDFDVVEYEAIESSSVRDRTIPLRGISVKGKGSQLKYALENTASILKILEDYFAIPYPYEKLDLVAVPDFVSGGMENAGLITYREQLLLLANPPTFTQQRKFARIHAHELAHQWFGNLVTMSWWDDLWLNESFATWMANRAMNQWNPKLEYSRDLLRRGHSVMSQDALINARRVREPIENNDLILSAFSDITYKKGGAVLHMLERFVGEQTFREGVQHYLQQFAYGHANAHDFIESMAQVSGKPGLKGAFFSFLTQPGVPSIKLDWHCTQSKVAINISQSRYLPLGSLGETNQQWDIPVCLTLIHAEQQHNSPEVCQIITQSSQVIEVDQQCPVAIMPNNQGSGYYRFSYTQTQWDDILRYFSTLSVRERYSVANNLAAAFRAGDVTASYYIKSVKLFAQQDEWDVITTPIDELQFIADHIASPSEKKQLATYLDILYRPLMDNLGLDANTLDDEVKPVATSLLRHNIVNIMALRVKEPNLRKELLARGKAYIGFGGDNRLNESVINEDLANIALVVGVETLGKPFFDALHEMVDGSSNSAFRQRGLQALGSTTNSQLAEEVRSMILSLSIKNNERGVLINAQMRSKENQRALFEWLKTYFSVVATVLPEHLLAYTPMVGSRFCTLKDAQAVDDFFSQKIAHIAGARRNLALTLERIKICVALTNKQNGLDFEK